MRTRLHTNVQVVNGPIDGGFRLSRKDDKTDKSRICFLAVSHK